jgi:hypothetical protein
VVAGLTACVGLFVLYADARYIFHEITTRGLRRSPSRRQQHRRERSLPVLIATGLA